MTWSSIQVTEEFKEVLEASRLNKESYEQALKRLIGAIDTDIESIDEAPAIVLEGYNFAQDGGMDSFGSRYEEISWTELKTLEAGTTLVAEGDHQEEAKIIFNDGESAIVRFTTTGNYEYTNCSNLGVVKKVEVINFNFL